METKQYLQNTVENLQTANEELKSANEELQSANEELKTAREEEQSVNEELSTVNAELQVRNEELTNAKNDLNNLLVGIRIATIFLDEDLHLRNFTPQATHLFNLIETDIGRPLEHVTSKLLYQHLIQDAAQVLRTLDRQEKEVHSETGQWYNMRLMPYRTLDNVIEGVVLTFEEITGQKETEQQLRQANHTLKRLGVYTQNIINTVPDGLMILSEELRILSANRSFYSLFNLQPAQAEGELLYDLDNGSWDVPELRRLLDSAADEDESFKNIIITAKFPRLGRRTLRLNGRRLLGERDDVRLLFVVEDISKAEDISEAQNNG
jgi:PAS domain-containing protein